MIIQNKTPVTRPAVAAKTYSEIWISGLEISLLPGQPGSATVTWRPWDAATDEVHPSASPQQLVIPNLKGLLAGSPVFAEAWEAVTSYLASHMAEAGIAAPL